LTRKIHVSQHKPSRLDKENFMSRSTSHLVSTRKKKLSQHKPSRLDKENSGLATLVIGAKENEKKVFIGHRGSFGLVGQVVSPRQGKCGSRKARPIASTYKF
jgi:hypothetical protein